MTHCRPPAPACSVLNPVASQHRRHQPTLGTPRSSLPPETISVHPPELTAVLCRENLLFRISIFPRVSAQTDTLVKE